MEENKIESQINKITDATICKEGHVIILLERDAVEKKAYEIANKHLSYDDYVWLWAELDLKIGPSFVGSPAMNQGKLEVDPSKICKRPASVEIKDLASEYASRHERAETIHWYIAERQIIYDRACA